MLKNNIKSLSKRGCKNPNWKGDEVGYNQLHQWIVRNYKKPKLCQKCKKVLPYDLANKGIYDRNIKNWEWLCRKCHMKSDGRMKKFLTTQKKFAKGNEMYKLVKNRPRGNNHPTSKLTKYKVIEIRDKYKTGNYTLDKLALEYSVGFQNISLIINKKTWKHV